MLRTSAFLTKVVPSNIEDPQQAPVVRRVKSLHIALLTVQHYSP